MNQENKNFDLSLSFGVEIFLSLKTSLDMGISLSLMDTYLDPEISYHKPEYTGRNLGFLLGLRTYLY